MTAEQKTLKEYDLPLHKRPIIDEGTTPEDGVYFCHYCFGEYEGPDDPEDCRYQGKQNFIDHLEIVHGEKVVRA